MHASCLSLQVVQQVPTGMIALRSVHAEMEESVNWMDLVYAPKGLLDQIAQRKVRRELLRSEF